MRPLTALNAAIGRIEISLASLCLFLMVVVNTYEIAIRTFVGQSWPGTQELTIFLATWGIFLGGGYAYKQGLSPRVDMLVKKLKDPAAQAVFYVTSLIQLVLFAVILYYGYHLQLFQSTVSSYVLHLPQNLFSLPVLVFAVSQSLAVVARLVERHPAERNP